MSINNLINQLEKHVKKQGINGLLPQNLPDRIFRHMILEVEAIKNNTTEETPSSLLFLSIIQLKKGKRLSGEIHISIDTEKLMEYFDLYATSLTIEDMRRCGDIELEKDSLPTLKNIFSKDRSVKLERRRNNTINSKI